jgi:hypothetical protein
MLVLRFNWAIILKKNEITFRSKTLPLKRMNEPLIERNGRYYQKYWEIVKDEVRCDSNCLKTVFYTCLRITLAFIVLVVFFAIIYGLGYGISFILIDSGNVLDLRKGYAYNQGLPKLNCSRMNITENNYFVVKVNRCAFCRQYCVAIGMYCIVSPLFILFVCVWLLDHLYTKCRKKASDIDEVVMKELYIESTKLVDK